MDKIICDNLDDTKKLAQNYADKAQNGDIFTLQGPLGAGKSEFARAFIQHLMGKDTEVPSPTFTLVQTYESSKNLIWHFDLYRLQNTEEIYEIGWEEALSEGILLIEWPERLGDLKPSKYTEIIITPLGGESRHINVIHHGKETP